MLLREWIRQLRSPLVAGADAAGARNVRLFGSVARGTERPASDIDFLVSLDPGRTLMDLARLEVRLERLLAREVDVVTEEGLSDAVRSATIREAVDV
jgi:predicted nucleotidyltransferase